MLRKLLTMSVAMSGLLVASARADFSIVSDSFTINNPGMAYDFNFSGRTAQVKSQHNLIGIRVDYSFKLPTLPGTDSMNLVSNLLIPDEAGQNFNLGFDIVANLADGTITSFSAKGTNSPSGLFFGPFIKSQLLDDSHLTGVLQSAGENTNTLAKYFGVAASTGATDIPGTISAVMTLTFTGKRGDTNGEPEPASIAIWAAIGGIGYIARRRFVTRKSA